MFWDSLFAFHLPVPVSLSSLGYLQGIWHCQCIEPIEMWTGDLPAENDLEYIWYCYMADNCKCVKSNLKKYVFPVTKRILNYAEAF